MRDPDGQVCQYKQQKLLSKLGQAKGLEVAIWQDWGKKSAYTKIT